eukprot:10095844-Alexandrium_andersonii.AAC.1
MARLCYVNGVRALNSSRQIRQGTGTHATLLLQLSRSEGGQPGTRTTTRIDIPMLVLVLVLLLALLLLALLVLVL